MVTLINSGLRASIDDICDQLKADRHKSFLIDARAFATGARPGSVYRLQKLIGEYRGMKFNHSRFLRLQRVLIVAECLRIKRDRARSDAGLQMAADDFRDAAE